MSEKQDDRSEPVTLEDDIRRKLLSELESRIAFDNKWAWRHLHAATTFTWVAILASFGSSLIAGLRILPPSGTAVVAALPGIAIFISQRFAFYRRSRWHCMMETNLTNLKRALEYEGADPRDISKRLSAFMLEMEPQYPGHGL